jgi:UDP-MurNAc hydroxylase
LNLTFYNNACCTYESNGFKMLCDPWLHDGAFEGSWHLYPPMKTKPEDFQDVDCLYVSHLHPDHFDAETLRKLNKQMPVVILDHGPNFLKRRLVDLGYENVIAVKDGQSCTVGPFELTLYAPFSKHVFHESQLGNLIDSAIVVSDGRYTILNANDNTPSLDAARRLRATHGKFSVAQLNFNAAGPFPSCFHNLSLEGKRLAHARVLDRNLAHLVALAKILEPEFVMPFAGAFVIGGKQWRKNEVLGTTTWDVAAQYVRDHIPGQKTIVLNEGLTYNLDEQRVINGAYCPVDIEAQRAYIENVISLAIYPYERRHEPGPELLEEIRTRIPAARAGLYQAQKRMNCFMDLNIYIQVGEDAFHFNLNSEDSALLPCPIRFKEPYLQVSMDPGLLLDIINREAHWNSAEVGCHVDFVRVPDVYLPDAHTILSFFHR